MAYEDPDFAAADATAASDCAEKTGDLILDAQPLTSAAAQMAAAAKVVTVLHPLMLPLLLASVIPCTWGAVRARISKGAAATSPPMVHDPRVHLAHQQARRSRPGAVPHETPCHGQPK